MEFGAGARFGIWDSMSFVMNIYNLNDFGIECSFSDFFKTFCVNKLKYKFITSNLFIFFYYRQKKN